MNKSFNFTKNKMKFLLIPVIVIVLGIVMYFVRGGFNFDVEFMGGIRMQVNVGTDFKNSEIEKIVEDATGLDAVIQAGSTSDIAIIKLPASESTEKDEENKNKAFDALKKEYSLKDEALMSAQSADPSFGKEVQGKAVSFTLLAILFILIYIIFRFDLKSGVMAIFALVINVLIMAAVYTTTNIAINTTFIAAMLTVIGYSINNTIVIFDRIRENKRLRRRGETIAQMTDRSISETMGRTINSTITTLITIVLIYILGVDTIKQFALPLIIGIIAGAYTSIFVASTFWAAWEQSSANAKAEAAAQKKAKKK
jgi:preprotein translocase SecF subunit